MIAAEELQTGSPQKFTDWKALLVDGAVRQSVFPRMSERMKPAVDGSVVACLKDIKQAIRLLAEKSRVIAEGAGALAVAAAISRKASQGPVVATLSGGSIDMKTIFELIQPSLATRPTRN